MDPIALVTGSSRNIGKAIALTLAQDGFDVIVHYYKSKEEAQAVAEEIETKGRKAFVVQADLGNIDNTKQMFEIITSKVDHLDLVVNNAGMDLCKLIEEYTIEEMSTVINSNLLATMHVTKLALPLLKKSKNASIINISSRMGGPKTIETIGAYGPAKAGIIKFTECCALEFADYKIRVNSVAPGLTYTTMNTDFFLMLCNGNKEEADKIWKDMAAKNPSRRVGQSQDVANVVSFLASDKASYINGETIGVNGGSMLG